MDFQNVKTASPTRLLLTRISAQAKRSSRPKAQLCRSAGREFLRSATPCAPPRMEVSKVYIGESARWRKSQNRGFGTHPESFVHIRCIFTALLPVLNSKTILNVIDVIAPRIYAGASCQEAEKLPFREELPDERACIALRAHRTLAMASTASRSMSMIATGFHRFRTAAAAETETQRKFPTRKAFID